MAEEQLNNKKRIAFFVKKDLDSFLREIINGLSDEYEVKKIICTHYSQIKEEMEWADICWFEWCDELVIYGSKLDIAKGKVIICRLHSYEAFTDYLLQVNWGNIDKLICVGEQIRDIVLKKTNIEKEKIISIPNGIDTEKYNYKEREKGFNVAYVGYINYKKGPMLLLHTFKAIYEKDNRYKLYIAGEFQDERYSLYFSQMIKEMGLENNVIYQGWQSEIDTWLEDKNFILCTSVLESQNMSVMQAMSKGIKPIIHNFVGAKSIYPSNYLWNTIDQAVDMVQSCEYNSYDYREFIEKNYNIQFTNCRIKQGLSAFLKDQEKPLITIVMTVYNRDKYISEAIDSVLNQSYKNIELIIVNDGSMDNSENIIKTYQDERIKYFYKENTGQLDTLRYGLERAKGEYIARVDSDDRIDGDYIKSCLKVAQKGNLDFVYTDFLLINDKGEKIGETNSTDYKNPYEILEDVLSKFSSVIPDMAFWRKGYINHVIVNYTCENVPYYIDNILQCKFTNINNKLYHYRQHESNFARKDENFKIVISGKIKFIDLMIRKYFIQMDINNDFHENKSQYLINFINIYLNQAEYFKSINKEICKMFLIETFYWFNKLKEAEGNEENIININSRISSIMKDADADLSYSYKNRRVLIVSGDNPNDGKSIGGKHIHIHLLQKALKGSGITNNLITYVPIKECSIDIQEMIRELEIVNFNPSEDINFMYLVYIMQKQLEVKIEGLLLSSFISYISCQDVVSAMAAHNIIKRLNMKIPIITTLHGYFTDENVDYGGLKKGSFVYNYFKEFYESKVYKASDKIIAVDTRIKEYVENIIGSNDKIHIIKNAINDIEFKPDFEDLVGFNENIILVPRRLVPKNGVIYAVRAAQELITRGINNFKLLIAGDGSERLDIENYIKTNRLEKNVHLLGGIYHDEILQYFKKSKIVVIPSVPSNNVEEATSLAALEGMACGKIVVASKIGGLKEIIQNGYSGYLTEPQNEKKIADILQNLITIDKCSYDIIGRNARGEVELKHGYIKHANDCLNVFDETL